ncbi:MAG: hypothetical protein KR126chlam2_00097 [Chlamydiae bacterium]|nr:hypothetical protein [Chlamydiota bacterium]
MQLLNLLLFWLFFGILSSHLAKKKGRNPRIWFFIGLLFGAFGVALLYLLPLFEKLKAKKAVVQPKPLPPQSQRREFWYYLDTTHKQQGPVDFDHLTKVWKSQKIADHSYLWTDGMGDWKKLSELPDLLQDFKMIS